MSLWYMKRRLQAEKDSKGNDNKVVAPVVKKVEESVTKEEKVEPKKKGRKKKEV